MEAEITIGLLLIVWIGYELFGRHVIATLAYLTDWSYILRIASGLSVLAYLYWQAKENPSGLTDTLDLAKQMMTHSPPPSKNRLYEKDTHVKEKRNVTNLMKKTVAANQAWACAHCKHILDSSYEVDHIVALFNGGTNEIDNLVALCRNCHGKKTMAERLPTK